MADLTKTPDGQKSKTGGISASRPQSRMKRRKIMLRLWKYLGRNQFLVIAVLILAFSSSVLGLYGPKLSGEAINAIDLGTGHVDFDTVYRCAVLMVVFYVASVVLAYLLQVVMIHLSRSIAKQMRHDIFNNLMTLPVSYFDWNQAGDIISSVTYDVETVNQSLANDLLHILQSSVTIVVSFVMMYTIAPRIMMIFLFTIPCMVLLTDFIARKVRPLFRRRSSSLGALNGFVEEMLSGQKTIHAYGQEQAVLDAFDEKNNVAVHAGIQAESRGTVTGPILNFVNNLSLTLVCVFGSIEFLKGHLALGDLSSFIYYSRKFSGPINSIANVFAELQSAFAAAERVFRLIDAQPELPDAENAKVLTEVKGDVQFKNVDFSYTPGTAVIENLNFHAKPGSLTAIVGQTGAGKTTIINLLMRFYDVNAGAVYVDGEDIRNLTRDSLRRAYTMVLQDTWLFQGTIFDNIAYGKENATMDDVVRAAKAAHIHSYISHLPNGYDTVLSDNGTSISKGQKQLLTIARAMLVDSHMLILDEATSNVDTQTEQKIQKAMRTLMQGKTCFVVAHRLSTIQSADHILVLDGGKVIEQGNHQSLMAAKGHYYRLYQAQFDSVS